MKLVRLFLPLLCLMALAGCSSYSTSVYLRNDAVLDTALRQVEAYEYRILPKDELTIVVSTTDPASSVPFHRKIGQGKDAASTQGLDGAKLLNYLVDSEGYIDYPVLGRLYVAGLTNRECESLLRSKLQGYLSEVPNVTVRTANFKVSVLGEVGRPGTYTVADERMTIFQALAEAGDMTLFADRDDVQLLREGTDGKRHVVHLDLTEADIVLSPYYYMHQNDIVYVKPKKSRVSSSTFSSNASMWISLMSLASTIASLVIVATN